jgi:hypothetical protein
MSFYWIWVPILAVYCVILAYFTKRLNDYRTTFLFWLVYFLPIVCNLWPVIAKYSKNLVFDGLLYDAIVFLTFYGTMLWMGAGQNFTTRQWVACFVIIVAMIVLKVDA